MLIDQWGSHLRFAIAGNYLIRSGKVKAPARSGSSRIKIIRLRILTVKTVGYTFYQVTVRETETGQSRFSEPGQA
jgi:hypothetical protein